MARQGDTRSEEHSEELGLRAFGVGLLGAVIVFASGWALGGWLALAGGVVVLVTVPVALITLPASCLVRQQPVRPSAPHRLPSARGAEDASRAAHRRRIQR